MISVITITYNNFEELVATCASLKAQHDVEHVIINGGTCEKTFNFLESYTPPFKTRIISENDNGIYDAFNKGVMNSSGEFVHILNSGDLLVDELFYDKSTKIFKEDNEVMAIHADIFFIDSVAGKIRIKPTLKDLGRGLNFNHPTFICRRSVFEDIGLFKTEYRFAGDYDWAIRFSKKKLKATYLDTVAVQMDGGGVSTTQESKSIRECFKALKQNNFLSLSTTLHFMVRVNGFFLRKLILSLGLSSLLKILKKKKHQL